MTTDYVFEMLCFQFMDKMTAQYLFNEFYLKQTDL